MTDPRRTDTSYDVIVLGGGSAGFAAAIGASRAGARTALIERYGFLGGMATAGMVGTICGLYRSGDGPPNPVADGFAAEFARLVVDASGEDPVRMGRTHVQPYAPLTFAGLADDLTAAEPNLAVYLHTHVAAILERGQHFEGVHVVGPDGAGDLTGTSFIDSTGDAVGAVLAGAATETVPVEERQLPSIVFHMQNVGESIGDRGCRVALLREVARAENAGELPAGCSNLALRKSARPGEVVMKIALSGLAEHAADHPGVTFSTLAERTGRIRVRALAAHLQSRVPEFQHSFVSHAAPQLGVRESRRVVGRYRLTGEDVLAARRFDDGIVEAAWPIEIWNDGELGPSLEYVPDGETYSIPLRSFQFRDIDNAYAVGRCMSGTHEALGSARVIGTCLEAGYAVGSHVAKGAHG